MSAISNAASTVLQPRNLFRLIAVAALAVALSGGAPAVYADCNEGEGPLRPCLDATGNSDAGNTAPAGPGQ